MSERRIKVQRHMEAPTRAVWAVFADFPHLAAHWGGLRASRAVGTRTSGVGARRRVALKPVGSMDETVTVWEEGRRIDTANRASALVPFSRAETTLVLEPETAGTSATFDYRYVPRGGPLGRFTGPLLDRMLTSAFADMLGAVDAAALVDHDEG